MVTMSNMLIQPVGRRGAYTCYDKERERVYMLHGSPGVDTRKHVDIFDINTRQWTKHTCPVDSDIPPTEVGGACVLVQGRLYTFGGWCLGAHNGVYELNLETHQWHKIEPISNANEPLMKNKHGLVSYRDKMLLIFGGYGYANHGSTLQKGALYDSENDMMWTNEIHLFHLDQRVWIVPETTGVPPKPCAAFSFNQIDQHRVLLFGGRQKPERVNEIHMLDMATWHWSGPLTPTNPEEPWPTKRSFHTASCLFDPDIVISYKDQISVAQELHWLPDHVPDLSGKSTVVTNKLLKEQQLLVLWGNDNDGDPVKDSWILRIAGSNLKWEKVQLPGDLKPRIWHICECTYSTKSEEHLVLVFGGAIDNMFNRLDSEVTVVDDTVLLKFGTATLYRLCQYQVIALYDNLTLLRSCLPVHIYAQLQELKQIVNLCPTKQCNIMTS